MLFVLLYSLAAGFSTAVGAYAVLARKAVSTESLHRLMGFGAGVLAGTAFLHLIPYSVPRAPLSAGIAMLVSLFIFIIIEQGIHLRFHVGPEAHRAASLGIISFAALFIHSLVDGLAIAVAMRASPELAITTTIAVTAHEVPEGITSASLFLTAGYSRKLTMALSYAVALATPAGAIIAWFFTLGLTAHTLSVLLAFAAGSFIYVVGTDILPLLHERRDITAFIYLVIGLTVPVALLFAE